MILGTVYRNKAREDDKDPGWSGALDVLPGAEIRLRGGENIRLSLRTLTRTDRETGEDYQVMIVELWEGDDGRRGRRR